MKVLVVDRGLIDGANMARLKTSYHIDTVVPLRKNMNAYQDTMGLTRLKDFAWEPYETPRAKSAKHPDHLRPQGGDQAPGPQHIGEGVIAGVVQFEADLAGEIEPDSTIA
jgi:hypothetical protein